MVTHLFMLRLCWFLLARGGVDWVCTTLGGMLPLLFLADGRGHIYLGWTTRWWVKRVSSCGQEPSFEELLAKHPELLNTALGSLEGWTEDESNKP
jgi:hypothetical protein